MAPAKKQSLIPIGFLKNPKKTTLKAHEKMEMKNGLTNAPAPKKKPFVDKKKQQRLKEEKEILEGGEGWRHFMNVRGFDDVERHDPCLMFQVYGPAPDPYNMSSSDDDITLDESKHCSDDGSVSSLIRRCGAS
jgi:hypothetical protein